MMMIIVLIALLCISQTYGFQMMKSRIITRERKSLSMTPLVDTVVSSNVDLLNQGLLISDAIPVATQGLAFLLIAAAIMVNYYL